MSATENRGYIVYLKGVEAKRLHLGNLVHDLQFPDSLEPYVETACQDRDEPAPEWATSTPLKDYALTVGQTSKNESDDVRYQVVVAGKTTKLEIQDPSTFFTQVTLKNPAAKSWLESHLSAAQKASKGKPGPQPPIWLLTGLVLMTHSTWTNLSSSGHNFTVGSRAPFKPASVSAMRRSSVSEGVKPTFGFRSEEGDGPRKVEGAEGVVIHETGKYPGTRAWAARWHRVEVGEGKGADAAELRGEADAEGKSQDLGDEFWDAFVDALDD